MVGAERFELPTLWSQTRCATRLRYAPTKEKKFELYFLECGFYSVFQEGRAIDSSPFKLSTTNHQKIMKISPPKKIIAAILLSAIFNFLLTSNFCFAWDGMDPKKNSSIEIESGNLVREGSIINFFDSSDGNYHTGKVLIRNSSSHVTELTIEDFTEKHQERFFLMNE